MMNDYAWATLHAHRESAHRTRALHRGGDDTPAVERALAPAAVVPALTAARRRTASDAPTAAALAWVRLASGEGSLAPATERGRDAA